MAVLPGVFEPPDGWFTRWTVVERTFLVPHLLHQTGFAKWMETDGNRCCRYEESFTYTHTYICMLQLRKGAKSRGFGLEMTTFLIPITISDCSPWYRVLAQVPLQWRVPRLNCFQCPYDLSPSSQTTSLGDNFLFSLFWSPFLCLGSQSSGGILHAVKRMFMNSEILFRRVFKH